MPTDDGAWRQDQEAEKVVPTDEYIQRITPVQRGEAGGGWGNEKVETSARSAGVPTCPYVSAPGPSKPINVA